MSLILDAYSRWNQRLLNASFSPAHRGTEVWLQATAADLQSMAPDLGGDAGFVRAVVSGPAWPAVALGPTWITGRVEELVERIIGLVAQRKTPSRRPPQYRDPGLYEVAYKDRNAPTYLPYLAMLVRVSSRAHRRYYLCLQEEMSSRIRWSSTDMERLREVWKDLESWTEETNGDFGKFSFRILGGLNQIGVPKSQGVMAGKDFEAVGKLFIQAGLRPGQRFTDQHFREIKRLAADSHFLTSAMKEAAADEAFATPLEIRIRACFEDWDGTNPSLSAARGCGSNGHDDHTDEEFEVALCPGLEESSWSIHWCVPPTDQGERLTLEHDGRTWEAFADPVQRATTSNDEDEDAQAAARRLLDASASGDITAHIVAIDDDLPGAPAAIKLFHRKVRSLIFEFNGRLARDELRERPLPLNGPAYLLAGPPHAEILARYMRAEGIRYQSQPMLGLPAGWTLSCIPECSTITTVHRSGIFDGDGDASVASILRFVGGRSTRRGGLRQYFSYDLPDMELDAPPSATLSCAGLRFDELPRAESHPSSIRRFSITLDGRGRFAFVIKARDGSQELAELRLRLGSDEGENFVARGDYSVDEAGGPRRDAGGLLGMVVASPPPTTTVRTLPVHRSDVGKRAGTMDLQEMLAHPVAQFLDSLANAGSIAIPTALEQMRRLLARSGHAESPSTTLLMLRARGHLELQSNHKGHLARVHAVPPTLYELPASPDGGLLLAIAGSLRLSHWKAIANAQGGWELFLAPDVRMFPSWRVVVDDEAAIDGITSLGLGELVPPPGIHIASWSASAAQVFERARSNAVESIGLGGHPFERLSHVTGAFVAMDSTPRVDPGLARQLFRTLDPDGGARQLYSLGLHDQGRDRFGFVRDSRWGVWIDFSAFARYVKEVARIEDAHPWPLHYSHRARQLLVPARMNFPAVLERALVSCAGHEPMRHHVFGRPDGDAIDLRTKSNDVRLATISRAYDQMSNGVWLEYKWVPEEVAEMIASKVDAALVNP